MSDRVHRATTRHLQSAYPWVGSDATSRGVVMGQDEQTGQVFAYDPWLLSDEGLISGPNLVWFGTIGSGKSGGVKSYLLRSLNFGVRARVLDVKGEYVRVADAVPGAQVVAIGLDGSLTVNPLDPAFDTHQQRALVEALIDATSDDPMTGTQRSIVAAVLDHLHDYLKAPTLRDLRQALWFPPPAVAEARGADPARVAAAAAAPGDALDLLFRGPLGSLVDGRSSVDLDPACPLLVADLSSIVPLGGTEVAAAMAVVGTWLQALLARRESRQVIVLDECWRLLRDASTARWLQASAKLAREYQAQLVTVFHRLSDLLAVGDQASEQVQIAKGLISDAETRVIYRQTPGDVAALGDVLGLSQREREWVPTLNRGVGLWRVGRHATIVRHVLSEWEAPLVETELHRRRRLEDAVTDDSAIHAPAGPLEASA